MVFDGETTVGEVDVYVKSLEKPAANWPFKPFDTETAPLYIDWLNSLEALAPMVNETNAPNTLVFQLPVDGDTADYDTPIVIEGNLKPTGGEAGEGSLPVAHWVSAVWAVVSVEWVAIDSPLDENPNTGGGKRIYPGKQSPHDVTNRKTVKARATILPKVEGRTVHFKAFDVDDPWTNGAPIDTNGASGGDNRGGAGTLSSATATTDAEGRAEVVLTVTMHPGDNFRVGAHTSALASVGDNDVPPSNESTVSNKPGKFTQMLTVWRKLHIERDSMASVAATNRATGNLTDISGIGAKADVVYLSIELGTELATGADNSDNLDSATPKNGRFENGTIEIGVGGGVPGKTTTTALKGNGDDYVRKDVADGGIDIPFKVSNAGVADCTGTVVTFDLQAKEFKLSITAGAMDAGHAGGTINVAGVNMNINAVDVPNSKVTVVAAVNIPFTLVDDDVHTLPTNADLGLVAPLYQRAYILPVDDGGGDMANNTHTVNPTINHEGNFGTLFKAGAANSIDSENDRADDFWIVYVLSGYQDSVVRDKDSDSEEGVHGMATDVVPGAGSVVYYETIGEWIRGASKPGVAEEYAAWQGHAQLYERRVVVHEITHQFEIDDETGGIMSGGWEDDGFFDVDGSPHFTDEHLDTLRDRVKSPGT